MPVFFREYRKIARLTLQNVADELRLSVPTIHKWEKEDTSPTMRDAERLAEVLGIHPSKLFIDPNAVERKDEDQDFSDLTAANIVLFASSWKFNSPTAWFHALDKAYLNERIYQKHGPKLKDINKENIRYFWVIDEASKLSQLLEKWDSIGSDGKKHLIALASSLEEHQDADFTIKTGRAKAIPLLEYIAKHKK